MKTFIAGALALGVALLALLSGAAAAQDSFVGRPVYSEPGNGLQMPPGCRVEPPWRSRLGSTDLEVWIVDCGGVVHTWMLRRSVLEMVDAKQARLRFQILNDRAWPGDTAGDSASGKCIRADAATQKFKAAAITQVDCTRFPDREAMLRRLQKAPR